MKSRTKSTRQNLTIDSKSRRISQQCAKNQKKQQKKDQSQTRKYLLRTLTLLQQHLKVDKIDKRANTSSLSANVYEIVKANISHFPKNVSKNRLVDYASEMVIGKENHQNEVNKSTASLLNMSSINVKRRSNSTLDQYFKEKFGSPAKDEETIQKKLRVLKALKKSQEIVSKVNQSTSNAPNRVSSSLLQDMSEERKILIVEKIKNRKTNK